MKMDLNNFPASDDLKKANLCKFGTVLADPPWRFSNRTGKMAPEHKRLSRYGTMTFEEIMDLPVERLALPQSHLYLWIPNALLKDGLEVMKNGDSPIRPTLFGTRSGKTAALTVVELVSTFET